MIKIRECNLNDDNHFIELFPLCFSDLLRLKESEIEFGCDKGMGEVSIHSKYRRRSGVILL